MLPGFFIFVKINLSDDRFIKIKQLINLKMMIFIKLSLVVFSLMIVFSGKTQPVPVDEETGLIIYQDVIQEEGDREEFFNRAIGWINSFYANPVDVTKTRNPESGIIKGLHRFKIKSATKDGTEVDAGVVQYEFSLEFREGRYRYTLSDFVLRQTSRVPVEKWLDKNDPQYNPLWDDFLIQVDDFAQNWIGSLKDGMKPPKVKADDDW
jgi:hypothetical protein